MSNLICPFCGEKIEHIEDGWCNCKNRCTGSGSIELWLQFLHTRKALDVALDWLGQVATPEKCDDDLCREFTKRKLAEIKTELEKNEK